MASNNVMNPEADPDYITYLFNPKDDYDWYFVVGNGKNNTPVERIGVVKKMLLARSEVFRRELHESELKEKNDTEITDIFPSTFRNLLRFLYGFDNTASLSFDDADDLLYAADKYMVEKLKANLASRLMDLLSYENICSLMNNPACYRVLELNAKITTILQYETRRVLASPQFPEMCAEAFLTILEQEKLQVSEIELWRSAVQWAKNKAKSDDGAELRNELTTHLPHIRVCTVSHKDFCREIMPTRVLTDSEMCEVCLYHGNDAHKPALTEICDVTEPRAIPFVKSDLMGFDFPFTHHYDSRSSVNFEINTKEHTVELCSLQISRTTPQDCTVEIMEVDCADPSRHFSMTAHVQAPAFNIDLPKENQSRILKPNSKYKITLISATPLRILYNPNSYGQSPIAGKHFNVKPANTGGYSASCVESIHYKTLTIK